MTDGYGDADLGLRDALELAYQYLNRRDRTVAELRTHLTRRASSIEGPTIERAIELLVEQGYLDDARYARLFAEDKRSLEQWGDERIGRALRERGIDRALVQDALGSQTGETELERALSLLRRRFPHPVQDRRGRDRALGVLLRKGYDSELALDALRVHERDAHEARLR